MKKTTDDGQQIAPIIKMEVLLQIISQPSVKVPLCIPLNMTSCHYKLQIF